MAVPFVCVVVAAPSPAIIDLPGRLLATVCVANDLREQSGRLAEASARAMDKADVAMEGVIPEVDRAHRRGPVICSPTAANVPSRATGGVLRAQAL